MEAKAPFLARKRNVVFTAIFYTFLWGTAFPLVKICMEAFGMETGDDISKCLLAGIRFFFSGLFTLLWLRMKKGKPKRIDKTQLLYILLYGVLATTLQYGLTYIGLSRIDGSKGAVFDQLCVFIIVLFSGLVFRNDSISAWKLIGSVLGFLGVFVINTEGMRFTFHFGGEGVMLMAALCQSVAYFIAKKSAEILPAPLLIGYGQMIGGGLLSILALLLGGRLQTVNLGGIITLFVLIAISAVAYVLSLLPLRYFPASETASFNLLITIFGVVMSALFLRENIVKWNYLSSLLLISFGILTINLKNGGQKNVVEQI